MILKDEPHRSVGVYMVYKVSMRSICYWRRMEKEAESESKITCSVVDVTGGERKSPIL